MAQAGRRGRRIGPLSLRTLLVLAVLSGAAIALAGVAASQTPDSRARVIGLPAAAAALGRGEIPQVRHSSLTPSVIAIDTPAVANRAVHLSYAHNGRKVALLTINRGTLAPFGSPVFIGPKPGYAEAATIHDGTTDVAYGWNSDGLTLVLHVNLVDGIDRKLADEIAASVR